MDRRLLKIIECLSGIKGVKEIKEDDGYLVFCYRKAYFLGFPVEGCGELDRYFQITLNFDLGLEPKQLDLAIDICFRTMVEYESLRLFINDDAYNSICIFFKADYEDKCLTKILKRGLNDSIAAHNFFIENFVLIDSVS